MSDWPILGGVASRRSRSRANLRPLAPGPGPEPHLQPSIMERQVHVLAGVGVAPPRTLHSAPLVKSSPLSPPVRSMIEAREFGRRFDADLFDVAAAEQQLPGLTAPQGDVLFLADDTSLDSLSESVDVLLQHRKRLLSRTAGGKTGRRRVLIIGAGPAGLISAVQLALRDHHVVLVEQRDVYSRNRYIGVYKEVTHLMAALGMPERMTYDFSQYRGKRGIMLADIQTFLHGIALKLGVVIYTGAAPRDLSLETLKAGEVELQRAQQSRSQSTASVGMTRWQYDCLCRTSSGVKIQFDAILEASGGRSGLREILVGKENVVTLHEIGRAAADQDPTLASSFDDPDDHCAEYVESGYGCPPSLKPVFAAALLSGEKHTIPEEIPCFVSNIDASIFKLPMQQSEGSLGLASKIGDRTLNIPHDWVVLECRVSDQRLSRYHIEGPLPQQFEFGGRSYPTHAVLEKLNPVGLLVRILYAMGVPFHAIDRRQLVDFYEAESSQTDASDIVGTWIGRFRGVRVGGPNPIWYRNVPGSDTIEYGIIGESLQNAWYRFGVGVDDAFKGAEYFADCLELPPDQRREHALRLERTMRSRAVQILYHLFAVARNSDQGVVSAVLTEYHMEEQHNTNLVEARLREITAEGKEILAIQADICQGDSSPLLEDALNTVRAACCHRALEVLKSFSYRVEPLLQAMNAIDCADDQWPDRTRALLDETLSEDHKILFTPLLEKPLRKSEGQSQSALQQERVIELAANRYSWVTPWLRACALRALDRSLPNAIAILNVAAGDNDQLISEVARSALCEGRDGTQVRSSLFERVLALKRVSIFVEIPHQLLCEIATMLTERRADPQQDIIVKGDVGDSLYIIAEGLVTVHDGHTKLRDMGEHEFFGELSLLDSEPRAATVTAIRPTRLFRLEQEDFYTTMQAHSEIVRALNKALCRLVRGT
jgi:cyclic nucleotide-binding protein/putative NAD(P)-binding protein